MNTVTLDVKPSMAERNAALWSGDAVRGNDDFSERLKQMDVERSMLFKEHEMRKTREKEVTTLEQLLK